MATPTPNPNPLLSDRNALADASEGRPDPAEVERWQQFFMNVLTPDVMTRAICRSLTGFDTLEDARLWADDFVHWYNIHHRHSGIRYVTPEQGHAGEDRALLAARHLLYQAARAKNPARWSRHTRNWSPIDTVTLNPERDVVVNAATTTTKSMPLAA